MNCHTPVEVVEEPEELEFDVGTIAIQCVPSVVPSNWIVPDHDPEVASTVMVALAVSGGMVTETQLVDVEQSEPAVEIVP